MHVGNLAIGSPSNLLTNECSRVKSIVTGCGANLWTLYDQDLAPFKYLSPSQGLDNIFFMKFNILF